MRENLRLSTELKEKISKYEKEGGRTLKSNIATFCEWILPKIEKIEAQMEQMKHCANCNNHRADYKDCHVNVKAGSECNWELREKAREKHECI